MALGAAASAATAAMAATLPVPTAVIERMIFELNMSFPVPLRARAAHPVSDKRANLPRGHWVVANRTIVVAVS